MTVFARVQREPDTPLRWQKEGSVTVEQATLPAPLCYPDVNCPRTAVFGVKIILPMRREPEHATPADVYFGRDKAILRQREGIKRKTLETRRWHHRQRAA